VAPDKLSELTTEHWSQIAVDMDASSADRYFRLSLSPGAWSFVALAKAAPSKSASTAPRPAGDAIAMGLVVKRRG
jgi:hypothetical protein